MKLCVVGIGGCGGNVASWFLENEDLSLAPMSRWTGGEHVSLGGIKGIYLDADVDAVRNKQKFFRDYNSGRYPGYFIPHDIVPDGSLIHIAVRKKYGYDVKKQGFFREAQYLKSIFEIFEIDPEIRAIAEKELGSQNPILDSTWKAIRPFTTLQKGSCDSILFVVSLGGGTGTGFINPILGHIREGGKTAYPVFVLGVLTEEGDETDKAQLAKEAQRDLGALISIYDLVTKRTEEGVDGLILVDNQIMMQRFKGDFTAINSFLYEVMKPMVAARHYPMEDPPGLAVRQQFIDNLYRPPILVPCYARQIHLANAERELAARALADGLLCGCDPKKADKAFVFSRGYLDSNQLREEISRLTGIPTGKIAAWRKLGENRHDELLILLRNPYGTAGAHLVNGTLEHRLHRMLGLAMDYIESNKAKLLRIEEVEDASKQNDEAEKQTTENPTRKALEKYFYGPDGIKKKFQEAMRRIEDGDKPFFRDELRIFDGDSRESKDASTYGGLINNGTLSDSQRRLIQDIIKAEVDRALKEKNYVDKR